MRAKKGLVQVICVLNTQCLYSSKTSKTIRKLLIYLSKFFYFVLKSYIDVFILIKAIFFTPEYVNLTLHLFSSLFFLTWLFFVYIKQCRTKSQGRGGGTVQTICSWANVKGFKKITYSFNSKRVKKKASNTKLK